ncbi:MAG: DNA-processing protein DprA [Gammaproteobacteria bacterium]|nr:DNA-processing protein DprA [Gammaproteobacteria bacterium]MDH5802020.1 DNA-processing protein DprA [Gammaproteobacteria bacterium]
MPETVTNRTQLRNWLALHHAPGVGAVTYRELLQNFGDPNNLLELFSSPLSKSYGLPPDICQYLRRPDWDAVDADMQWLEQDGNGALILHDPLYPEQLKQISDPPPVLFYHGDPQLLKYPQIAIVGSRNPSHYGAETAYDFGKYLASTGLIVTSGLAVGVDAAAHKGALAGSGLTVAVAGTGLDRVYPARNRELAHKIAEQGVLISEFSPGTPPMAGNFPRRNRIISGLSLGTLVVEAALKSGSLITAKVATEQGREVFAIPGSIHNPLSKGCHSLIRQGAKLVETGADILEELGPAISAKIPQAIPEKKNSQNQLDILELNQDQQQLLNNMGFEPVTVDALVDRSQLTVETVSAMLMELELRGCVTCYSGLYTRAR